MAVICLGLLFSALIIAQWGFVPPLVATFLYAFLSIRMDDASILDFLRYAVCFLLAFVHYITSENLNVMGFQIFAEAHGSEVDGEIST